MADYSAASSSATPTHQPIAGPSSSHADSPVDIAVKRSRDEDDGEDEPKPKARVPMTYKRNPKACTCCRKVKMKCVPTVPAGDKCQRCTNGRFDCQFLTSLRGRTKTKPVDFGAKLKSMQDTLDSVLLRTSGGTPLPGHPAFSSTLHSASPHIHMPNLSFTPSLNLGTLHGPASMVTPGFNEAVLSELTRGPSPSTSQEEGARYQNLGHLDNTPDESTLIADQLKVHASAQATLHARSFAAAHIRFPMRSVAAEPKRAPELLLKKIISVEDVKVLFDLYFTYLQPQVAFLDRELHTPTYTALLAPFLFTCICTVASRYLPNRPGLYAKCRAVAIRLAADNVFYGLSSISIVQGCLILALWNQPGNPDEGDRAWSFGKTAVALALELNLHIKTDPKLHLGESEEMQSILCKDARNRERTWYFCLLMDQSLCLQLGKPLSGMRDGYLARHCRAWSSDPMANSSDAGLSAVIELHAIIAQALDALHSDGDSFTGVNQSADHTSIIRVFLIQSEHWRSSSLAFLQTTPAPAGAVVDYRPTRVEMLFLYYRIFLLSFGIQHSLGKPHLSSSLTFYVVKGFECATEYIKVVTERLGVTGFLRYAMDATLIYITYSAAFLLKLIQPAFATVVDATAALSSARNAVTLLENAAADEAHTPFLYAKFLRSLIASKVAGDRTAIGTRVGSRAGSPVAAEPLPDLTASLQEILDANANEDVSTSLDFDTAVLDDSFWSNMLMPGFGGKLGALSAGGAMVSDVPTFDGWGELGTLVDQDSPHSFSDSIFAPED